MNLERLNAAEEDLLLRVGNATGLMEEKHLQLKRDGVYTEYREIFEKYVELIDSDSEGAEALKRATFLLWYEQAEPSCFTGLFELHTTAAHQKVYDALEQQAAANGIDLELACMLRFYDEIAEWVFQKPTVSPNLMELLRDSDCDVRLSELKPEKFVGRGQMGEYWTSISTSNATADKTT